MPVPNRPDAIVFDLDGTLVDTVDARIEAWRAAFAERGISVDRERLEPMIGMDGRRLATEVLGDDGPAEEVDRRAGTLFDERNRDRAEGRDDSRGGGYSAGDATNPTIIMEAAPQPSSGGALMVADMEELEAREIPKHAAELLKTAGATPAPRDGTPTTPARGRPRR